MRGRVGSSWKSKTQLARWWQRSKRWDDPGRWLNPLYAPPLRESLFLGLEFDSWAAWVHMCLLGQLERFGSGFVPAAVMLVRNEGSLDVSLDENAAESGPSLMSRSSSARLVRVTLLVGLASLTQRRKTLHPKSLLRMLRCRVGWSTEFWALVHVKWPCRLRPVWSPVPSCFKAAVRVDAMGGGGWPAKGKEPRKKRDSDSGEEKSRPKDPTPTANEPETGPGSLTSPPVICGSAIFGPGGDGDWAEVHDWGRDELREEGAIKHATDARGARGQKGYSSCRRAGAQERAPAECRWYHAAGGSAIQRV